MDLPLVLLIVSFVVLLVLNVPIAFAIGIASLLTIFAVGGLPAFLTVAYTMTTGIDSFSLLAIPFFILAGNLMGQGGIARRLIAAAETLVGRLPGGLAYVNILTCMAFGAISGSAAAAVSSIGGAMVPLMNRAGYDREFNAAVSITAATTGLLIPPSNVMIVYSLAAGGAVSVAAIFMAGILPGILVGLGLLITAAVMSVKNKYGRGGRVSAREGLRRLAEALPPLSLIVLVLGGILSGVFTATEASAIAVLYALLLSVVVYREVKVRDLPAILLQSGVTTSVVFLLIGASMCMSYVLAHQNIPQQISAALLGVSKDPAVILIIINLLLLFVGTFMDMTPAVLIFTPIFLPVVTKLGVDPVHFGIIMITNLCIGICTPPVGACLFVGCGIAETTISKVMRPILPFFLSMIITLFVITFVPQLSLALPKMLHLLK
ncbi:MAG: TRAP transporter large permease [candidate division KSB1 bacterium]|nr:TRAP transporter large permease [candidate division KSB1 bacterium]